ncbi:uncharacterized protein LOC131675758 [Phymastichus coffea]|uniref:uncharacterized protein LOC131675758 n=1 Tax=Phymastichus coffea TaxID=108790 RepID=UPI00273B2482|nr:uncharacterized protein LOC131675758 [Phymastichus coffea]
MGWFTKGSGRTYDSLSGTATLMGKYSKKVLSTMTLNRVCKKCEIGLSKDSHDCRLNFYGTAKAMEPYAAVKLTKDNDILASCNVEVGVIITDNDSSAIAAMRNSLNYEIVKQADKNHQSKGVTKALWKIQPKFKELNGDSINYLDKCFNYCVSQNINDAARMTDAVRNIPNHSFNLHALCGSWCKFKTNPDTYRHKVIGDGFKNPYLYDALIGIFDDLANRTQQYSAGAFTNPNESMNASIVSRASKSRLYSKTIFAQQRVAVTSCDRNEGQIYKCELSKKVHCSPGKYIRLYANQCYRVRRKRYAYAQTPEFKRRRLFLKKRKIELRKKTALTEGCTYESDCQLLKSLDVYVPIASFSENAEPLIVLFDLETSGFAKTADILQIAAKFGEFEFCTYTRPSQAIDEKSSKVHGLRFIDNYLEYNGNRVESVSLTEGIIGFYEFLYRLNRKCILTAVTGCRLV